MSVARDALTSTSGTDEKQLTEQQKDQRYLAYLRHREETRQKSKIWRAANKAKINWAHKQHEIKVKAGATVPKLRYRTNHGFAYAGTKPSEAKHGGALKIPVKRESVII